MLYARKEAVIERLQAVSIHGLPFYDVYFRYTDKPDLPTRFARVQGEMMPPGIQVGDRVLVESIENTVMRIDKL